MIDVVAQRLGAGQCRFRDEDHDHVSVLSECGALVYRHGHPSHVLTFELSSCSMPCTKTNVHDGASDHLFDPNAVLRLESYLDRIEP
jgi:hypothetical protein